MTRGNGTIKIDTHGLFLGGPKGFIPLKNNCQESL